MAWICLQVREPSRDIKICLTLDVQVGVRVEVLELRSRDDPAQDRKGIVTPSKHVCCVRMDPAHTWQAYIH